MTVCPIAIAVGCARCPVVKVCPLKGVLGDAKPASSAEAEPPAKPVKAPSRSDGKTAAKSTGKPAAKAAARKNRR